MKILYTAAKWLFVLCLPLLLLSASLAWAMNSHWLYTTGFRSYGVAATTGLSQAELSKAAQGLIAYFNSGEEYIDITLEKDGQPFPLFNEREIAHLKDVKSLFRLDYAVLAGTLAYCLLFAGFSLWRHEKQRLGWALAAGGALTLALVVALGAGSLFGFDWLFLQFHLLSFANDFWLLDPSRDYLIMLFPRDFWLLAALVCAGMAALLALALGLLGLRLKKRGKV